VSHHQANHARILALRAEAEALEAQLKASVGTLADLRRELLETPATTFTEDSRPVPFTELLQYARNISRYTVPPTYREPVPKAPKEEEEQADKAKEDGGASGVPSNGLGTPATAGALAIVDGAADEKPDAKDESPKEVTPEQAEWLAKLKSQGHPWMPWPDEHKIRRGSLMSIQILRDQGKDPWTVSAQEEETEPMDMQNVEQEVQEPVQLIPQDQGVAVQQQPPPEEQRPAQQQSTKPQDPLQFTGFNDFDDEEEEFEDL
jgi:hypothetical protein